MAEHLHDFPETIELTRDEYRAQHAALEAAFDLIDRFPDTDVGGFVRDQLEQALQQLLRRIWPFLDEIDDDDG